MSFLVVVVVVFLLVWLCDSGTKAKEKNEYRKRTITNVKLQDERWCENFKMLLEELEEIDKETPLNENTIIPIIEELYRIHDIRDDRTGIQRADNKETYLINYKVEAELDEPEKFDQPKSYLDYIWYGQHTPPHFDRLNLLFGEPYDLIEADGLKYVYDHRGCAYKNFFDTIPARLICQLCINLTVRDLKDAGFHYSWNREESWWQQLNKY